MDNNQIKYIDYDNLNYTPMLQQDKIIFNDSSQNITLVSAFFDIGRENWSNFARSSESYIESFFNYFDYDYKMIIFMDDRYVDKIIEKISNLETIKIIPINNQWLEDNIPCWKLMDSAKNVMNSEYYKQLVSIRIDYEYPENLYPEYNLINHAKIDFICYAINNSLITEDFVCWTDFGYFMSILCNNFDDFPTNSLNIQLFNLNKINFCLSNKLIKDDEDINYTLLMAAETFTGTFWAGSINNMKIFQKMIHNELEEMIKSNIFDDDQYVYLKCFLKNPDLFELFLSEYEGDWPRGLNYFEKNFNRHTFVSRYIKNIDNGIFVEIGTDKGDFADFILSTNNSCTLYCVDPYTKYDEYNDAINNVTGDELYESVKKKLTDKYQERIKFIRKFSHDAVNEIPDNLDFVYIDGNHCYKYAHQDIVDWYPKVKSNGIIIGDDAVDIDNSKRNEKNDVYIEWMPGCYGEYGVVKAFEDFIQESGCFGKLIGNQFILRK